MFRNVTGSARAAISGGDTKPSSSQHEPVLKAQNEFCAEPVYVDDIDALRNDPRSPKAQEARSKLARAAVSDDDIWREVKRNLRQSKVTTNMCASIIFNDIIIQDVVIKALEQNNQIETRAVEAACVSMLKFVRNPFTSGGTGVRAMNEEEALSSLRGVLKKPLDPSHSICTMRTGRRGSDPFSDRRTGRRGSDPFSDRKPNRKMFLGSSNSGVEHPSSSAQGLDPCGRRDSERGSFTMNIFAGDIPTSNRSQSWNSTIMQVNEKSNLYDVCRSITLDHEDCSEAEPSFCSFVSTAMKRCSFSEMNFAVPAASARPDQCEVAAANRAQPYRPRLGNRSSWTAVMYRASSGISNLAGAQIELLGSKTSAISEEDNVALVAVTPPIDTESASCLLEDFPSTRNDLKKVSEFSPVSSSVDGSSVSTASSEKRPSLNSNSSTSAVSVHARKPPTRRRLDRSDSCLARAA